MTAGLRIEHYDWAGGREAILRFGQEDDPVVIVAPALFEEANRTRSFLVATLRLLAAQGIASALPDLPGQNESTLPTEAIGLRQMTQAFAAASRHAGSTASVSLRGGAILDSGAPLRWRWRFSPLSKTDLLAELGRMRAAAGHSRTFDTSEESIEIGGSVVSAHLIRDLAGEDNEMALPFTARTVRLASDPRVADCRVPGPPLWRRSEAAVDDALSQILAADIADWLARCGG